MSKVDQQQATEANVGKTKDPQPLLETSNYSTLMFWSLIFFSLIGHSGLHETW